MGSGSFRPLSVPDSRLEAFPVNIVPDLKGRMKQCLLNRVKTGTPVIVLKHLSSVIDFLGRLICIFYIAECSFSEILVAKLSPGPIHRIESHICLT